MHTYIVSLSHGNKARILSIDTILRNNVSAFYKYCERVTVSYDILTSCWRTSSGTFLVAWHRAAAEEWEKMTGALVTARASLIVCWDT